jgi:hypothetical protein
VGEIELEILVPLAQVISANLLPIGGVSAPAFGPVAAHYIRGFHVPRQEQTNWCWSAVAKGVAAHIGAVWQQCDIASLELGQSCCPAGLNSGACNIPWYLDRALMRVGHFGGVFGGVAAFAQLAVEIAAKRPVGVRIGWAGGGGHFIAIRGYSIVGPLHLIDVEDPWYAASVATYAGLQTAYKGSGTWTHSYWTT